MEIAPSTEHPISFLQALFGLGGFWRGRICLQEMLNAQFLMFLSSSDPSELSIPGMTQAGSATLL